MKINMRVSIILMLVVLSAIILLFYPYTKEKITNFEECIAAGNPAMESYPRKCRANGQTFVEQIEDSWRLDGIILMQHESEGYYGCFGCSTSGEEPVICIDPIFEMKKVEETSQRYCNSTFKVVEDSNNEIVNRIHVPSDNPMEDVVVSAGMPVPGIEPVEEMIVEE